MKAVSIVRYIIAALVHGKTSAY